MNIRNVVFDLDGTLIDSAELTGKIIDQMLAERGVKKRADRSLIREMDAVGGQAMIAAVLGPHCSDPEEDTAAFRTLHRSIPIPANLAFPGVFEALDALENAGIGLAICSNKPQDLCEKILIALGLSRHFAAIVGSAPGRPRKPAPDAAHLAVTALAGTPADTLYCGDSVVDLVTAKAVGLPFAVVEWGYGTTDALKQAPEAMVIKTMSCLVETLLGHDRSAQPR